MLLEREEPVRELARLAAAARNGSGSLAVVEGAPGEGKSALMREAGRVGERAGLRICRARGTELERPYALGVVRQLLVPILRGVGATERSALFGAAARVGMSALDPNEDAQPLPDPFAVQHGLYWLLLELAVEGALMLLVDDAHWADESSLLWLASLVGRIGELPVLLVLATRPVSDASTPGLGVLASDPQIPLLRLDPLGRSSIAALTRAELGAEPDEAFTDACHHATAGNPLAVIELLRDLGRKGAEPTAAQAVQLGDRAPEAIERHVRGRLDRLGVQAVALAQVLAVLGDGTNLRRAATLAGVQLGAATALADQLTHAGIFARTDELRFEHPLVRAAVHDSMSAPRRAQLHSAAAALLIDEDSEPESVAAHLLRSAPAGEQRSVDSLRAAANVALQRGAPDTAVVYLRRTLAEPPPPQLRSVVLGELAGAAWATGQTTAMAYLERARALAADRRERAGFGLMLAEMYFYTGHYDRTVAVIESALADLDGKDTSLEVELRVMHATFVATVDSAWPTDLDPEQLIALAGPQNETGRELQLTLAFVGVWTGAHSALDTAARVNAVLDESMVVAATAGSLLRTAQGVAALIYADQATRAIELSDGMLTHGAANGIAMKMGNAYFLKGMAELRCGSLADSEADLAASLDIAIDGGASFAEAITRSLLAEVLVERGRLSEAVTVLDGIPGDVDTPAVRYFRRTARSRLHRASRAREGAIAELTAIGQEASSNGIYNPRILPWRSELAHLLAAEDPARACQLADSELLDAERLELPSAIGAALRARGACERGRAREETLRESVAALEEGPARLELTRALIDLGAHLRRSGRRRDAREPLRIALDLASRCSAEPLVVLARDELRAADGRPRSPWLTGAAALTPSELRVARLAAGDLANKQIAEALFITVKTVEMHLTNVYRKLGAKSRAELPRLLESTLERP